MILQSAPGWLQERLGRATASRMKDALAKKKDGSDSEARRKYAIELITERVTGLAIERFVSDDMKRGSALEEVARGLYEIRTGELVGPAALIHHPTIEWLSATPDGFLGDDGLLEIKVPRPERFIEWRMSGEIPEEHIPQMTAQLSCTGRAWVEFVAYCDKVPPSQQLYVRRFIPTPQAIAKFEADAIEFLAMVEVMFEQFTEAA